MRYTDQMRERDSAIVREYLSGRTMTAVGAVFKLTRERVRQILKTHRIPFRDLTTSESAFWDRVDVRGADECWPWTACRNQVTGYGRVSFRGNYYHTHRLAFSLSRGNPPSGLCVLHHCDNPPCCNPFHLYVGTHGDNARDRENRGRGRFPRSPHATKTEYYRARYWANREKVLAYQRARYAARKARQSA